MQQFAIKFFYAYRDYHEELAVYSDPLLRPTLPPIFHASTNDDQDAVLSERYAPRSRVHVPSSLVSYSACPPC